MKKLLKWGGIALIVLIIIGVASGSDKNGQSSSSSSSSEESSENKVYKLGEDVVVGEVRWKLVEAKDRGTVLKASESKYATIAKNKQANPNSKFVQVTVEVENRGKEMKTASGLKLIDSQGREFISSTETSEWVPEGKELYIISNLNPNVAQTFVEIYEVPADATGLKLMVGDLAVFGSNEAQIELGL